MSKDCVNCDFNLVRNETVRNENFQGVQAAIIYKIPILDCECVKKFITEAESYAISHNKSDMWLDKSLSTLDQGLKVIFLHIKDTDEQCFDRCYVEKEMVFQAYFGFNSTDFEMYPMGEFCVKDIDELIKKYKNNPDFIFKQLDWNVPKDQIIEEFVQDLKKYDFE